MRKITSVSLLLLIVSAFTACAKKPLIYAWGSYEDQIYALYSDTEKTPFEEQIERLESDYQRARAEDKPVPPGYHPYLGYLYYQIGKADQALQSFETEKKLFPESTKYMDFLIARLKK